MSKTEALDWRNLTEEEVATLDYTRMREMAAEMVAAVRQAQARMPSLLHVPELAVFERLVAGERVHPREIDRAYTMLGEAAKAARKTDGRW